MLDEDPIYALRLATDANDLRAAQRLRYRVFVQELGADGPLVDHAQGLERDEFDPLFDHLILVDQRLDPAGGNHVVGAYRLLPSTRLGPDGRFYSEAEYDLTRLRASGRRLVELGRSCVDPDHRGGTGMFHLWNGLAEYVLERGIEILFGVASFHGTDVPALAPQLAWLHHNHLAPPDMRVTARPPGRVDMNLIPVNRLDRKAAMAGMPALIKAYLRLGGCVGDGAYLDRPFNTTDVCLVMDTGRMSAKHRDFYLRKKGPA
ncbi:GNAT family N-acetyltransferase [Pseudogemmobacter blasticus]|uniref:L-ornithine N(alpha)-acyltransferase n=1 Tax=Fuscovulum blasticum DSM 2131 TaxID=1188250 RepID=A0A2T4JA23_FUSBL|nr:GNAT family N-acyltransferase [Fuscovulum blasticum]AWD20251.1 ornithine-acyl-ACP acyltransferase [Fuscovulum blasticum]PTE14678.1 ornithine-acyl-ACP acyltransferase [Fuscovulum blasticum DSM 2131]